MATTDQYELGQVNKPLFSSTTFANGTNIAGPEPKSRNATRATFLRALFDLLCLAWIAPIVVLLVLNYNNWIVGAGVGCRLPWFKDDCYLGLLGLDQSDPASKAAKLDQTDHEILGALQLVAKALEVWFGFIATSLVYDLTMILAKQSTGLPVAYLLTHVEFGDISSIFSHVFWRAPGLFSRQKRRGLYAFAIGVALLCVTCNLMGPATAVLVIPTLGWSTTVLPGAQMLGQVAVAQPPTNPTIAKGCNTSSLVSGDFTCTGYYLPELEEISANIMYGLQEYHYGYNINFGVLREAGLSFTFNATADGPGMWAPNRQVVREMSDEYVLFETTQGATRTFEDARSTAATFGLNLDRHTFHSYRNALDVTLARQGPSLNSLGTCVRANATEVVLSDRRSVRCYYLNISLDTSSNQYPCFRIGAGWNATALANSHFSIGDSDPSSTGNVAVGVYLDAGTIDISLVSDPCITEHGVDSRCDWEAIFSNYSYYWSWAQEVVEYRLPQADGSSETFVCPSSTYSATLRYQLDMSPATNTLGIVSLILPPGDFIDTQLPVPLHPDWILAAWAVPTGGLVDGKQATAKDIVSALKLAAATQPPQNLSVEDLGLKPLAFLQTGIMLHALTLVDFTTLNETDPSVADKSTHPPLTVSRTFRVWAYGHSSHTFKVGLVVVLFGSLCVFIRVGLGFFIVSRHRCTLRFLAAAMKYRPADGEFDGVREKSDVAKLSVRVVPKDDWLVDFVPPQGAARYRPVHGSV